MTERKLSPESQRLIDLVQKQQAGARSAAPASPTAEWQAQQAAGSARLAATRDRIQRHMEADAKRERALDAVLIENESAPADAARAMRSIEVLIEFDPGEPVPGELVPGEPVPGETLAAAAQAIQEAAAIHPTRMAGVETAAVIETAARAAWPVWAASRGRDPDGGPELPTAGELIDIFASGRRRHDPDGDPERAAITLGVLLPLITEPTPARDTAETLFEYWDRPRPARPFLPKLKANLPRWDRVLEETRLMTTWPRTAPEELRNGQYLMDLGETLERSWLLDMYARAGGAIAQGKRLPFDLQLAVGAMVHLAIRDRDFQWHTIRFPHTRRHAADWPVERTPSIEEWIYGPDGFGNPSRDWRHIPEALYSMRARLSELRIQGHRVAWAFPSVIPETPDAPIVEFTLRIPRQAAHGARLEWARFRAYAAQSAILARAYLSAVDHMGNSARNGYPITRELPAPVLNAKGKPLRRKGGRIVRSATERTGNPHACYVRRLSGLELAQMCGFDTPGRKQRARALAAFERLEADDVIELHREGDGFRIFGPAPGQA